MSIRYRLPNITGTTEKEQLQQLKSFLYQLVEQLNNAPATVESTESTPVQKYHSNTAVNAPAAEGPEASFNKIKALIIKSADIVDAYSAQINTRLDGKYVAQSEYGDFVQETSQTIQETSAYTQQVFTNVQKIDSKLPGIEDFILNTKTYIKTGELFHVGDPGISLGKDRELPEGTAVCGVAVGELISDGSDTFFQYAMFTPYGLGFYDENGIESAYITDQKLYIPQANIVISLTIGGYEDTVDADGGVVTRWIKNTQEG